MLEPSDPGILRLVCPIRFSYRAGSICYRMGKGALGMEEAGMFSSHLQNKGTFIRGQGGS